jgi:3-phosphoshikimate 1-carboxyvinyltransferase
MLIDRISFPVRAELLIPGDKSISHRALMLSSLSRGRTEISNFLGSEDTLTTLNVFRKLGVDIDYSPKEGILIVKGKGKYLNPGSKSISLYMSESGTTIRLVSGILAGQRFPVKLLTADSLKKRPMGRIIEPLRLMGANISGRPENNNQYPPLRINPVNKDLTAINYKLPVPSAQVKSCLLFAGLYSKGATRVIETNKSRNHTELMLKSFRADIKIRGRSIEIKKTRLKTPGILFVPSDFSSAAFFVVLGLLLKDAIIKIKKVSINPTRTGLLKVLRNMGADIKVSCRSEAGFEPYADITVKSSRLKGIVVKENQIPRMIDEIPLLFVAAAFAEGETLIYGLKELKVKETDRINSMKDNLRRMGVDFQVEVYKNRQGFKDYRV